MALHLEQIPHTMESGDYQLACLLLGVLPDLELRAAVEEVVELPTEDLVEADAHLMRGAR